MPNRKHYKISPARVHTRKLDRMVAKKAAAKMGYRRINKNQWFATNWREFTA